LAEVTLGKLKDMMSTIQSDSMDISESIRKMESKEPFGKEDKLSKLKPLIPLFQALIPSTLTTLDFGSQSLTTSSTSTNLMLEIIMELSEKDKMQNILQVFSILMIPLNKVRNLDLSNNTSSALLLSEISSEDTRNFIIMTGAISLR
jgi:hypothetical protein